MVAIFLIVIIGLFGTLLSRYTIIGSTVSAEEYLWAQALYSAEAAAQLRILNLDGGSAVLPDTIQDLSISATDDFSTPGTPATLKVEASRLEIKRKIEINFIL